MELDLGRIVPDPSKTIRSGAHRPLVDARLIGAFWKSCSTSPRSSTFRSTSRSSADAGRSSGCSRASRTADSPAEGVFPRAGAAVVQDARAGLLEPLAALQLCPAATAPGCGPRPWPSRSGA